MYQTWASAEFFPWEGEIVIFPGDGLKNFSREGG